ncbi:MAG: hypothetical protein Q6366_015500 [Candidatus Freyarchaeota archaeon]|jgi:uncharacterized protein (UPF0212 family)|nr:hypothetical protein [Candidatus Jordarchaeia archaeon]MBS7267785.1 hypothetical protein [Candidatus Jordarchaeia archaeon]MBS7280749.1 hypothetical protein [Candidatus Jordarchaeia archaeon]
MSSGNVTCPKCGFTFNLSYSRTFACGSCPSAALGDCGYIKCPKCKHEFESPRAQQIRGWRF